MHDSVVSRLALYQPRNLSGLIDIYEGNYYRLLRLIPELDRLSGTSVSRVNGALDLHLTVLERFSYTTTIALTYRFARRGVFVSEPNMRIRVYHDACVAEVMSHHRRRPPVVHRWQQGKLAERGPRSLERRRMPEIERRWEMNRFCQKWLGFCLRQGHLFLRCMVTPADAERADELSAQSVG